MKFYSRLNKYKASNVELDLNKFEARSYDWWVFVKRINGKLVFNTYTYSYTTRRHQWKVRHLIERDLGLNIDIEIEAPKGLQSIESAIDYYEGLITNLQSKIDTKGSKKMKNIERIAEIEQHRSKIKLITDLIKEGA